MNTKPKLLIAGMMAITFQATAFAQDGRLIADGNSAQTYKLMRACGFNHECPDSSRNHAAKHFQHITQVMDDELKKPVFVFHIHADIDDDRGKAKINDRQRNEIKTDSKSPASMIGQEGETIVMRWKFKLPEGFATTKKFSHIHQIKGVDNKQHTAEVGPPLLALVCYSKGDKGEQVLRLRHHNRHTNSSTTLAETDLAPFLGQWVEAEETITCGENGRYSIIIKRMKDGREMFKYNNENIDMWRTRCAGIRPKWGIYRHLGANRELASQLRDEQIRFADFSIEKK